MRKLLILGAFLAALVIVVCLGLMVFQLRPGQKV